MFKQKNVAESLTAAKSKMVNKRVVVFVMMWSAHWWGHHLDVELQVLIHGVDVVKDVPGNTRDDSHELGIMQVSLETRSCLYCHLCLEFCECSTVTKTIWIFWRWHAPRGPYGTCDQHVWIKQETICVTVAGLFSTCLNIYHYFILLEATC